MFIYYLDILCFSPVLFFVSRLGQHHRRDLKQIIRTNTDCGTMTPCMDCASQGFKNRGRLELEFLCWRVPWEEALCSPVPPGARPDPKRTASGSASSFLFSCLLNSVRDPRKPSLSLTLFNDPLNQQHPFARPSPNSHLRPSPISRLPSSRHHGGRHPRDRAFVHGCAHEAYLSCYCTRP